VKNQYKIFSLRENRSKKELKSVWWIKVQPCHFSDVLEKRWKSRNVDNYFLTWEQETIWWGKIKTLWSFHTYSAENDWNFLPQNYSWKAKTSGVRVWSELKTNSPGFRLQKKASMFTIIQIITSRHPLKRKTVLMLCSRMINRIKIIQQNAIWLSLRYGSHLDLKSLCDQVVNQKSFSFHDKKLHAEASELICVKISDTNSKHSMLTRRLTKIWCSNNQMNKQATTRSRTTHCLSITHNVAESGGGY
jgi:hypothetical protein